MSANKTPLQVVNEMHGGKEKLVDKVMGLIERGEQEADDLRKRLLAASNKQLLRLVRVSETVRDKYGSTEKLAEAVAAALGRAKDSDYVKRLGDYSPARLLDMAQALARRAGGALPTTAAAKAAPKAEPKAKPAKAKAAAPAEKAAKTSRAKAPKAEEAAKPAKKSAKKK